MSIYKSINKSIQKYFINFEWIESEKTETMCQYSHRNIHNNIDFFFRIEYETVISNYDNILIWLFNSRPMEIEGSFCGILLLDSKENILKLVNLGLSERTDQIIYYDNVEHFHNDLFIKISKRIENIK